MITPGIYRWNGAKDGIDHLYEVIGVALDTIHKEGEVRDAQNHVTQFMETVVYRATYKIDEPQLTVQFGPFPLFTRTLESFNEADIRKMPGVIATVRATADGLSAYLEDIW